MVDARTAECRGLSDRRGRLPEQGGQLLAVGLGDGAVPAIVEAASSDLVVALAVVDPVLDDVAIETLSGVSVPMLGCAGRFDDLDNLLYDFLSLFLQRRPEVKQRYIHLR